MRTKKEEVWKSMRPELYTIFWYINLQSLVVPEAQYKQELKRINDQMEILKSGKDPSGKSLQASGSAQDNAKKN